MIATLVLKEISQKKVKVFSVEKRDKKEKKKSLQILLGEITQTISKERRGENLAWKRNGDLFFRKLFAH